MISFNVTVTLKARGEGALVVREIGGQKSPGSPKRPIGVTFDRLRRR